MKINIHIKDHMLRYSFFGMLLFICSMGYSQQDPSSELVGTWLLEQQPSFASIDASTQARLDSIPQLQSQLLAAYSGRRAVFGSDGSYTVSLSDGRSASGSWQLISATELKLTDPSGNISYQRIIGLDTNRLVLEPMSSGDFKSIIKQLHFTKL